MAQRTFVQGVEGEVVSELLKRGLVGAAMVGVPLPFPLLHLALAPRLPLLLPTTHKARHLARGHGEAAGVVLGVIHVSTQVHVVDDLVHAALVGVVVHGHAVGVLDCVLRVDTGG